eukprot:7950142-Heterocapsa_arctica.AAC.1
MASGHARSSWRGIGDGGRTTWPPSMTECSGGARQVYASRGQWHSRRAGVAWPVPVGASECGESDGRCL